MNLHGIANPYAAQINPNVIGTLRVSTGNVQPGDAVLTGSIAADVLTVTAMASGELAVDSVLASALMEPATLILEQLTGTPGQEGTYRVSVSQALSSATITASGVGINVPGYQDAPNLTMQFQAVTGEDLKHIDGLNQQAIYRSVYMSGRIEGVDRPATKGGDLLLAPTGLTATPPLADTWLVSQVLEPWDTSGWCKVIATLQQG